MLYDDFMHWLTPAKITLIVYLTGYVSAFLLCRFSQKELSKTRYQPVNGVSYYQSWQAIWLRLFAGVFSWVYVFISLVGFFIDFITSVNVDMTKKGPKWL